MLFLQSYIYYIYTVNYVYRCTNKYIYIIFNCPQHLCNPRRSKYTYQHCEKLKMQKNMDIFIDRIEYSSRHFLLTIISSNN